MKKLIFTYGTMNSSKSLNLIATVHNYEELNKKVLLLTPSTDDRYGIGKIKSRAMSTEYEAIVISQNTNIKNLTDESYSVIIVDEVQFLTKEQIIQLWELSQHITVMCYGLKSDFKGELFPATELLLSYADEIRNTKTLCHICGNHKANFNSRWNKGKPVTSGQQIQIGDEEYKPVCKKCWKKIMDGDLDEILV